MNEKILDIQKLCVSFGGIRAVDNLDLSIGKEEIVGIIGPNGSGKSTVINLITGVIKPDSGTILFKGQDITGTPPYLLSRLGISRIFQNIRIFKSMTVLENVVVGLHSEVRLNTLQAILNTGSYRKSERLLAEKSMKALKMVGLENMADRIAGTMGYGQQKRLEIARALVSGPSLCLLDEPIAGMNSGEAMRIMDLIKKIREEQKIAFILIEHNMQALMSTVDHVIAIDAGHKIAEGSPSEVAVNEMVVKSYLGGG